MNVVCISGKAQNGKDTSAQILCEMFAEKGIKAVIFHYADLLKFLCKQLFGWNGQKDDNGRRLLQYVGTDIVREKDPDFWVDFMIRTIRVFDGEWDCVIIPDCRFPNEIHRLKNEGIPVKHIRIIRENFDSPLTQEQQQHISETALDNEIPDYIIYNTEINKLKADLGNLTVEIIAGTLDRRAE